MKHVINKSNLEQLIGQTAAIAYRSLLLSHHDLKRCTLFKYKTPPPLQQRVSITTFEKAIIEQALSIREQTKIPFWEAIFSACIKNGKCSDALLEATFYHSGQGDPVQYDRDDIESGGLDKATDRDTRNVSLCSKVFDSASKPHHLGFLDFHCDVADANKHIVHSVCRILLPQGFLILDSGDSYHATSLYLMSNEQRIFTLGKAIRVSPIIDSLYIAHQLNQSSSSIRISKGGKAKKHPIVVDAWCPGSD